MRCIKINKINKEFQLKIPHTPNFIQSFDGEKSLVIAIQDLSDEDLRKIGENWTEELIKKAKERRL